MSDLNKITLSKTASVRDAYHMDAITSLMVLDFEVLRRTSAMNQDVLKAEADSIHPKLWMRLQIAAHYESN